MFKGLKEYFSLNKKLAIEIDKLTKERDEAEKSQKYWMKSYLDISSQNSASQHFDRKTIERQDKELIHLKDIIQEKNLIIDRLLGPKEEPK